jgi:hydroxymethylglutaryl-CoA lyase
MTPPPHGMSPPWGHDRQQQQQQPSSAAVGACAAAASAAASRSIAAQVARHGFCLPSQQQGHQQPRAYSTATTLPPTLSGRPLPSKVVVVEVGPRDGLQNEPGIIPTPTKVRFVELLADAGLSSIEATSFVSPKWVPQLADAEEVMRAVKKSRPGPKYTALTPNLKGFERAVAAGADEVAIFGAASEAFSRKNINCSIRESLDRFRGVVEAARAKGVPTRGYVSCAVHCPYSGDVDPEAAARVAKQLYDMGCYEVSLGDTTGKGTPAQVAALVRATVAAGVPLGRIAAHLHDTYGQALANALAALQEGVAVFDASAGGLGGCPYSPGASGNVATEDLVYMLDGLGVEHGVDLSKLVAASRYISRELGREPASHVARAMAGQERVDAAKAKAAAVGGAAGAAGKQQQQTSCAAEARAGGGGGGGGGAGADAVGVEADDTRRRSSDAGGLRA